MEVELAIYDVTVHQATNRTISVWYKYLKTFNQVQIEPSVLDNSAWIISFWETGVQSQFESYQKLLKNGTWYFLV